jgi:uncharacterized protein involved in outer membrane biogenesis
MHTWVKIVGALLICCIIVVVSAALILKSRLVPETIERVVIPRLEEMIDQPISYGKLTIGLWGTITIEDVSVGDATLHKDALLFTCPHVVFSCRILPLLSKQIVIDRVAFHQPHINLVRDEQGSFNVTGEPSRGAEEKSAQEDRGDNGDTFPALSFLVNQLTIDEGVLTFAAYPENSTRPFRPVFNKLNLAIFDFSMRSPFTIDLSVQSTALPSSRIVLKAVVDPLQKQINPHLTIHNIRDPRYKVQAEGMVAFNDDVLTIEDLKLLSGDSLLSLNGRLENCFAGPLAGRLSITSPALVVDEIIPCIESIADGGVRAEDEDADEDEQEADEGEELGPFDLADVNVDADIVIDRISFRDVHLSDVHASCSIHDNTANLESVEGAIEDGSLQMKSRIGLGVRGLTYTAHLKGSDLQLASLMAVLLPDVQADMRGSTDLTMVLNGSGTTKDSFKDHLTGEGTVHITDGSVSGLEFLQSLASFIKLDDLGTLSFDRSEGTFKIADGLIHTTNSLTGKEIELYPEGTVSLDSYVNLSLTMKIAPSLSEKMVDGVLTKYFKDEKGWTVLSLSIKGPSDEVVIMPASSTIKNISEMLVDILLKKEDSDNDERQDKKKALEGLLKKLMKKPPEDEPPVNTKNVPATQ